MPYAHITEFDFEDGRNTVNYDSLGARLFDLGQPAGAIRHSAGFDDAGVGLGLREHRAASSNRPSSPSSPRVLRTQRIRTDQTASTGTSCIRRFREMPDGPPPSRAPASSRRTACDRRSVRSHQGRTAMENAAKRGYTRGARTGVSTRKPG